MTSRISPLLLAITLLACGASQSDTGDYSFLVMDRFTMSRAEFDLMITGQVKEGKILSGSNACLIKASGDMVAIRIDVILRSRKQVEVASIGDIVALGVSGVTKDDVAVGDLISAGCA